MQPTTGDRLLKKQDLEDILGSFVKATGLHVEAVDNKGETFFIPNNLERCEFCQLIRSCPDGINKCQESYKRASLEAAKWGEPYFFRCHAGLVIWSVPIVVQGSSIGSIICGQVLMWKPDNFFWKELERANPGFNTDEIKGKAALLQVISPERAQAAAEMLFVVVNHLVKRDARVLEEIDAAKQAQESIRRELEERKRQAKSPGNNYNSFLRRERRFLQFMRLGDRTRAKISLESLLADLYCITLGDKVTTLARVLELAALSSRAAVEGGADAERTVAMLQQFQVDLPNTGKIEEAFARLQKLIDKLLDDIFILADKKHLSLVNKARDFILENYDKTLKVEDVAQHLFISPSHLSRLFREEMDCTVNDYLTRVRVEKAVELMKKPELNVEQVAKAVGLQNQSYFAKIFKTYIGVTPLIYRNSLF